MRYDVKNWLIRNLIVML